MGGCAYTGASAYDRTKMYLGQGVGVSQHVVNVWDLTEGQRPRARSRSRKVNLFVFIFLSNGGNKFKLECSSTSNTQNEDVAIPLLVKNKPRREEEQALTAQIMEPRCVEHSEHLLVSITEREEKLKKIDDNVSKHAEEIANVISHSL